MKLKTVVMFAPCNILPVRQGSDRFIVEIAKCLHQQRDLRLKIVICGKNRGVDYSSICSQVEWISVPPRWRFWDILNKFSVRTGLAPLSSYFQGLGMRRRFMALAKDADYIILNYLQWFKMIPADIRKRRTLCVTHDLLHYRIASFKGCHSSWERFNVWANKVVEFRILRGFHRIGILADYEERILQEAGFPMGCVVKTGMPIQVSSRLIQNTNKRPYDFVFLGGGADQNIMGLECFFERVVACIPERRFSMAIAGAVCHSKLFSTLNVPKNLCLERLGYVDDVGLFCQQGVIGVGTVPCGSGIKVKVVEMLMHGLPMIVTDHGIEGVPVSGSGVINIDREPIDRVKEVVLKWLGDPKEALTEGISQALSLRRAFCPEERLASLVGIVKES